jgi:hypothetical protein
VENCLNTLTRERIRSLRDLVLVYAHSKHWNSLQVAPNIKSQLAAVAKSAGTNATTFTRVFLPKGTFADGEA